MAPAGMQDVNVAVITAPDDKTVLLAEEEQAQQDADALVQVLKEANCKHNKLATKQCDVQATQEKCKVDQCEADVKVRGRLLANVAVAEVWRWYACQANKARLAAEKLHMEQEASQSPWKVWMQCLSFIFIAFEAEKGCRLP